METGVVPGARLQVSQLVAEQTVRSRLLKPQDLKDLERFEAGEGHDLPKLRIQRLAELGLVHGLGFGRHGLTSFGLWALGSHGASLPLETSEEINQRLTREHRQRLATSAKP